MARNPAYAFTGKVLVFTVTPGRSGTTLLAELLRHAAGLHAEHEPAPRVNYVMRSVVEAPSVGLHWLVTEKLPAILRSMAGDLYVETSHLIGKGFVEPLLTLGIDLKFILLTHDASLVARSLHAVDCIPERTESGRLICVGPSDLGVLAVEDWPSLSDYQLCYWYALEMERRQRAYAARFSREGVPFMRIALADLLEHERFGELARFLDKRAELDLAAFRDVVGVNQNPRGRVCGETRPTPDTDSRRAAEADVRERVRRAAQAGRAMQLSAVS